MGVAHLFIILLPLSSCFLENTDTSASLYLVTKIDRLGSTSYSRIIDPDGWIAYANHDDDGAALLMFK